MTTEREKEYNRTRSALWRKKHPYYVREYCKRWNAAHPGINTLRKRLWNAAHPGRAYKTTQKWKTNNPEALRAHRIIEYAIRIGELIPQPCEICGNKADAHHDDYSLPLSIRWMCRQHHIEHHRRQK